jgi:hypothetical protein
MAMTAYEANQQALSSNYGTKGLSTLKNPNPLDAIGTANESVQRLVNRLDALADRLVGPTPTAVGSEGREQSTAVFSEIMERANSITSLADDGMEAINRIERLLP